MYSSFTRSTGSFLRVVMLGIILLFGSYFPLVQAGNINRSVEAYKRGYHLYFQKKYRLALQYFLLSYQSLPEENRYNKVRNTLNFLVGDCYNRLKQKREAYVHFKAYVDAAKKQKKLLGTPKYKKASRLIKKLQQQFGLQALQPNKRISKSRHLPVIRAVVRRTPPPSVSHPHTGAWMIMGTGVAVVLGGLIAGSLAQNTMNQANSTFAQLNSKPKPTASEVSTPARAALAQATAANALYVSGGILTGLGTVLLFTWQTPAK